MAESESVHPVFAVHLGGLLERWHWKQAPKEDSIPTSRELAIKGLGSPKGFHLCLQLLSRQLPRPPQSMTRSCRLLVRGLDTYRKASFWSMSRAGARATAVRRTPEAAQMTMFSCPCPIMSPCLKAAEDFRAWAVDIFEVGSLTLQDTSKTAAPGPNRNSSRASSTT